MMKLGICIKGYWKDTLFDVDLPRGAWTHCSVEYVSGFAEDYFDFDEDHIVDYLLEHRYSWGTDLPDNVMLKLKDKIDPSDKWLNDKLDWHMRHLNY